MYILAIVGSQRKRGNTARLVQMIGAELGALAGRAGQPLTFETLYLGDLDIHPCRGCRSCFDRGEAKCPERDDLPAIKAKMDAADGLLLASPVYVDDVSGLVKTWMDRLAYLCHRPGFGGKCAYALATVGGSPTRHTLRTMNGVLLTWGYHLAGQTGLKMGALTPTDEMDRFRPEAVKVAARLFGAIAAGMPCGQPSCRCWRSRSSSWPGSASRRVRMMSPTGVRAAGWRLIAPSTWRTAPAGSRSHWRGWPAR